MEYERKSKNSRNFSAVAFKQIKGKNSMNFRIETQKEAEYESLIRINSLNKSGTVKSKKLANKLKDCNRDCPCCSSACPICFRERRKLLIKESLDLVDSFGSNQLVICTLIFYSDQCSSDELIFWDLSKLKTKLYKRIQRIGFKGFCIGGFEMDYHVETKKWLPHFHLLMTNEPNNLAQLRKLMNKVKNLKYRTGVKNRPIYISQLNDPLKQVSYIFKTIWSRVEVYKDNRNQRRTKKYRLRNEEFVINLLKLDSISQSELVFKYGLNLLKNKSQ